MRALRQAGGVKKVDTPDKVKPTAASIIGMDIKGLKVNIDYQRAEAKGGPVSEAIPSPCLFPVMANDVRA